MKANEFVKNHGIAEAKRVLNDARGCVGVKLWGRYEFFTDDLKRLVESHDLVEKVGGLLSAKANINEMVVDSGSGYVSDGAKLYDYDFSFGSLRKAIADVESCVEVSSESN